MFRIRKVSDDGRLKGKDKTYPSDGSREFSQRFHFQSSKIVENGGLFAYPLNRLKICKGGCGKIICYVQFLTKILFVMLIIFLNQALLSWD